MEPATPPPSAYVIAQTGPGSAFSAGSPTNDPTLTRAPSAKQPKGVPAPSQQPDPPAAAPAPAAAAQAPPPAPAEPTAEELPPTAFAHPTYAASDYRPRGIEEKDLCARASSPDYVYMLGTFALAAGAVAFDSEVAQGWGRPDATNPSGAPGAAWSRTISTGVVGFTWGMFLGGAYLSLPKCSPDFVPNVTPEGSVTTRWPLAVALSVIAGISAPFLVYIEQGATEQHWAFSERGARIYVPALSGVAGALLPWIPALAPKTYRNMLKLERLRIQGAPIPPGADRAPNGMVLGYSFAF